MEEDDEVRKVLQELFKQEELVEQWLNKPKWYFYGLTPSEMLEKPGGIEIVLEILNRIRYGDF
ncbi:MbcA/ParS/Xre antitoxin family protein [Vibrio tasmaniensis]|uniref:MbcA/ParS/Xre antitoxin family protein n=1 Tax=Vibrio tasmaniensis TaxID=212663 RepID=UPI00107F6286|nr:MbcA/ParS/Xre antitoxin family protein [Vibrio tasmaniensis]